MATAFTPGPWKVFRAPSGAVLGVGDAEAGGVTDYQGGFWRDGKEKRANIELVATAPELYEMLQEAVAYADPNQCSPWIGRAMRVLAKARGEQVSA